MTSVLSIEAVQPNPEDWGNEYGKFKGYTVTVKSASNGETRDVKWNRKIDAQGRWNEPKVGDQIEADVLQQDQPPGWRLKNVKFPDAGSGSQPSGGGGSYRQDDPAKTADIHRQVALKSASALFGPMLAQVDPTTSTVEWWARFWALYDQAVDRMELAIQKRAQPQMPLVRKDIERTGQSDVPGDGAEFSHPVPSPAPDEDPIPF